MKKVLVIILSMVMLCVFGVSASAETVKPEGFTTQFICDFSQFGEGESTVNSTSGFWAPPYEGMDVTIVFADGKVTFNSMNIWGAFPSLNDEQTALTQTADGWGFYVKNEGLLEVTIGAGFNAANDQNYVLGEFGYYVLVDMQGNMTKEELVWNGSNVQGGIMVPEEFEGYVYIPFSVYVGNDGNATGPQYDPAIGVKTPIYSLNDGEMLTYGEFFAFNSDYSFEADATPAPTPTPEETEDTTTNVPTELPTDGATDDAQAAPADNGWILWVAIAAVVVIAIVVVIATKKKSK